MKRLWIGVLILALLLAGSLAIGIGIHSVHHQIAVDFAMAAEKAATQQWDAALALTRQARSRWERYHAMTAAFADHTPMDEMDCLLAELEFYASQREQPHFSSTCGHLSTLASAMAESHLLTWWNLL